MLCFPGNKNVLGAAKVMGLMRNILHCPSTNSALQRERYSSTYTYMQVFILTGRSSPLQQQIVYCGDKTLKYMGSRLLFGSAEQRGCLAGAGVGQVQNLSFQTGPCSSQQSSVQQSRCQSMSVHCMCRFMLQSKDSGRRQQRVCYLLLS